VVDDLLRTTNPHIWAAGDLTGHPQFTHTAGVHASLAASNAILGLRRKVNRTAVPRVTFTDPEVAAVGLEIQVAQLLLEERVDDVVSLPQTTVAALLGVRRPSVNRVLRKFARGGLVEISYGRVQILDAAALADLTTEQ